VKRLRYLAEMVSSRRDIDRAAVEAADRIESLEAEVARLREVLDQEVAHHYDTAFRLEEVRDALGEVVAWADDLRLFSEPGTRLAPVFQKAKAVLTPPAPSPEPGHE